MSDTDIKDEYDFKGDVRVKFYREGATLVPPVHLDPDVLDFWRARAAARGIPLSEMLNLVLRKDKELLEVAG